MHMHDHKLNHVHSGNRGGRGRTSAQLQEPRSVAVFTSPTGPVRTQLQEHGIVAEFTSPAERRTQRDVHDSEDEESSSSSTGQGLRPRTRAPKFEPGPSETSAILFQMCTDVSSALQHHVPRQQLGGSCSHATRHTSHTTLLFICLLLLSDF